MGDMRVVPWCPSDGACCSLPCFHKQDNKDIHHRHVPPLGGYGPIMFLVYESRASKDSRLH
jgi:hypothetical protein